MAIIDFIFVICCAIYFTYIKPIDKQINDCNFGVKFFITIILIVFFTGFIFYINYFFKTICNILSLVLG